MSTRPKKILIAEDEKPIAKALELKLTSCGYQTKSASDGEEALNILDKEKFDLIILDIMMPKIDGFGVLKEMNKRKIKTPVIITSILAQEEDQEKAKQLGASKYFVKSKTSIVEIVEYVKKII